MIIDLDFNKTDGLLPVIAQDYATREVLMLAYINLEAWNHTLKTGKATYYSRSRENLWVKGETSGNIQKIMEIRVDCDNDTVLYLVDQIGKAACHTGHISCFHKKIEMDGAVSIIGEPIFDPAHVYGNK